MANQRQIDRYMNDPVFNQVVKTIVHATLDQGWPAGTLIDIMDVVTDKLRYELGQSRTDDLMASVSERRGG